VIYKLTLLQTHRKDVSLAQVECKCPIDYLMSFPHLNPYHVIY